jgi:dipicolinate synthase subunit A
MAECLAETGVVVIGGDLRQVRVVEELANSAAWVGVYGLDLERDIPGVYPVKDLETALTRAGVIIFPISGVDAEGTVRLNAPEAQLKLSGDFLRWLEPGTLIVTGSMPEYWRKLCVELGLKIREYAEIDEVAIPNAIPTAEGAIMLAMEAIPVTLHQNPCLILGFGRVAKALARMLLGIGAQVIIAARNPNQRIEAQEWGCKTIELTQLSTIASEMWVVYNTIPAPILKREFLSRLRKGAVVIDLASAPGGTDFSCAEELGINAVLALGLPGKIAPLSAGEILASTIPALIERELAREEAWEARTCTKNL